ASSADTVRKSREEAGRASSRGESTSRATKPRTRVVSVRMTWEAWVRVTPASVNSRSSWEWRPKARGRPGAGGDALNTAGTGKDGRATGTHDAPELSLPVAAVVFGMGDLAEHTGEQADDERILAGEVVVEGHRPDADLAT